MAHLKCIDSSVLIFLKCVDGSVLALLECIDGSLLALLNPYLPSWIHIGPPESVLSFLNLYWPSWNAYTGNSDVPYLLCKKRTEKTLFEIEYNFSPCRSATPPFCILGANMQARPEGSQAFTFHQLRVYMGGYDPFSNVGGSNSIGAAKYSMTQTCFFFMIFMKINKRQLKLS